MATKKINKTKKAFTFVELSIAIAFISLLLITITTLVLGLIAIYRKGITINAVNSVGRSIIEDFQNSIAEAQQNQNPENICKSAFTDGSQEYEDCINDSAKLFIYNSYFKPITISTPTGTETKHYPKYGFFCTGSYSYIWNTGYALSNENDGTLDRGLIKTIKFSYEDKATHNTKTKKNFRLLKITDRNRSICKSAVDNKYKQKDLSDVISINTTLETGKDVVDLIAKSDTDLAIYYIYLATPATNPDSKNAFYSGSFILGTLKGGVDVIGASNCKPPGSGSEFDYCAINKFNFAVQGNGG